MKNKLGIILFLSLLVSVFQNCSDVEFSSIAVEDHSQVSNTPGITIICDPFQRQFDKCDRGFIGDIYTLDPIDAQLDENKNVDAYITKGIKINDDNTKLAFPEVLFPTQLYDKGFAYGNDYLRTPSGEILFEYFALDLSAILKLQDSQEDGYYQFALIADDGAKLSYTDSSGSDVELVNNDGFHATKLKCSPVTLYLDKNSLLPLKLKYFQGPRMAIALSVIWRKAETLDLSSAGDQDAQSLCEDIDADFFGDYQTDPVKRVSPQPGTKWESISQKGWSKISVDNLIQFN